MKIIFLNALLILFAQESCWKFREKKWIKNTLQCIKTDFDQRKFAEVSSKLKFKP